MQSRAALDRILSEHRIWLETNGARGKQADFDETDLSRVDFSGADLTKATFECAKLIRSKLDGAKLVNADLYKADFTRANLSGADLSGADDASPHLEAEKVDTSCADVGVDFTRANLPAAKFDHAKLQGAYFGPDNESRGDALNNASFIEADLAGADFTRANLTNANFSGATLTNADFSWADLRLALYEPKDPTDPRLIGAAYGLADLIYKEDPKPITDLRNSFRDAGFTQPGREVNEALHRHQPEPPTKPTPHPDDPGGNFFEQAAYHLQQVGYWVQRLTYLAQQILFDWPCAWGASPGRPLLIILVLCLLCTPVYWFGLHIRHRKTGLFLVSTGQRIATDGAKQRVLRICVLPSQRLMTAEQIDAKPGTKNWERMRREGRKKRMRLEFKALRVAFLFSLMSVFQIGFEGFNGGVWIRMLQQREFDIRARGWMRTVSGVQSLLGLGLLALSILSYFGHPFE